MVPKARSPAAAAARVRGDAIEQPGDLAGGKIRIEQQPGLGPDLQLMAAGAQGFAHRGGAPVLPDDGVVDRLAGRPVPDHRRFALVADADAGDVFCGKAGFRHGLAHGGHNRAPDFLRVVLDLARRRIDLAQFLLRAGKRL